ncbi:hypothetical protein SteCoe_28074 [Stentor coeruleus]|uniref:Nbr1 FW domain-containing protein n=1 Tax=Stentor coeruleus TaxID=5963 RepID=A0A1R2B8Z6_9CILI|nr:hypothetical protein SteCoe_28074 [Stentor coeruleus]
MSIFSYKLQSPSLINSIDDLKLLISSSCKQIPDKLFALMLHSNKNTAFRLCCQDDIQALKQVCKSNSISILYTAKSPDISMPFKGFEQSPLTSFPAADFTIISIQGLEDGSDIGKNSDIAKSWKIKIIGNHENLTFRCIEGEYFGVRGQVLNEGQNVVISIVLKSPGNKGWCSSMWRMFTGEKAFGPFLWMEFNVAS